MRQEELLLKKSEKPSDLPSEVKKQLAKTINTSMGLPSNYY